MTGDLGFPLNNGDFSWLHDFPLPDLITGWHQGSQFITVAGAPSSGPFSALNSLSLCRRSCGVFAQPNASAGWQKFRYNFITWILWKSLDCRLSIIPWIIWIYLDTLELPWYFVVTPSIPSNAGFRWFEDVSSTLEGYLKVLSRKLQKPACKYPLIGTWACPKEVLQRFYLLKLPLSCVLIDCTSPIDHIVGMILPNYITLCPRWRFSHYHPMKITMCFQLFHPDIILTIYRFYPSKYPPYPRFFIPSPISPWWDYLGTIRYSNMAHENPPFVDDFSMNTCIHL